MVRRTSSYARNHPNPLPEGEGNRRAPRLIALLALLLTGCVPPKPAVRLAYFGPTESMAAVAAAVNANNTRIPSLYALLSYRAQIVDPQNHHTTTVSGDGTLLFRRPRGLLLRGKEAIAGEIFAIGSNDSEFWLKIGGEVDTTWWGHYANLGKPGCQPMPIRPDLVLEVLGITTFNADLLQEPAPTLRFNNDSDAYMFDWNVRGPDRWITQKEIWYDRVTKLPELVLLFDDDGRVVLRAKLSQHLPLPITDLPREQWPKVASRYDLFFPDNGSTLTFTFNDGDLAISRRGYPKPFSFRRPDPSGSRTDVQVDAGVSGLGM